jgi:TolB-like protein
VSFWEELRRRNVVRVGIAYAVGAWLVLQLTEVLSELLDLPAAIGPVVVSIVLVGFPIVLLVAWVFELTPEGIKRESEVDRSQPRATQTGARLNALISVLLAVAVVYLLLDKFVLHGASDADVVETSAAEQEPAAANSMSADASADAPAGPRRQSIAVLPFENRSRLEDDEFFVEGVHDDLLTTLARIGDLKVISRTSVSQYTDSAKTIPQIAEELGVATVMEGAVQRSGDMVRINVQLIDAATDEHLWAEIYDREMTAGNLFAIQSEISEQIARALEATLTQEETQLINEQPTDNLAAYNAYLRGRRLQARRNTVQLAEAMGEFRRAVELDPEFALAWVGIGETATILTGMGAMSADERNRVREEAANRAIELAPELGEAWLIYAYTAESQEEAEARNRKAIELSPNYATAYQWLANLIQDDFRRLEEAQQLLDTAVSLDPLSPIIRHEAARNLQLMGHTGMAARQFRKLLDEDPEFVPALDSLAEARMLQGEWVEGVQLLRKAAALDPGSPRPLFTLMQAYVSLGYREGITELRDRFAAISNDYPFLGMADAFLAALEGRPRAALEHLKWVEERMGEQPWLTAQMAQHHLTLGEFEAARDAAERAFPDIFDPEEWASLPDGNEGRISDLCIGGYIMTRTGDEEAGRARIRAGKDYVENELPRFITGRSETMLTGLCNLAYGNVERALQALETMAAEGDLSWVRFFATSRGPLEAPIREQLRFRELLAAGEAELDRQRQRLREIDAEAARDSGGTGS